MTTCACSIYDDSPEVVPMRDAWATWGAHLPAGSAIVVTWVYGGGSERIVSDGLWCYPETSGSREVGGSAFAGDDVRLVATLAPLPEHFGQPRPWEPQRGDLCAVTGDRSGHGWPVGTVVRRLGSESPVGFSLYTVDPTVTDWEGIEGGGRCRAVFSDNLRPATDAEAAAWRAKHGPLAVGDVIPKGADEPTLEALPVGSVVRDGDDDVHQRCAHGWTCSCCDADGLPWGAIVRYLPATVVRVGPAPEQDQPEAKACECDRLRAEVERLAREDRAADTRKMNHAIARAEHLAEACDEFRAERAAWHEVARRQTRRLRIARTYVAEFIRAREGDQDRHQSAPLTPGAILTDPATGTVYRVARVERVHVHGDAVGTVDITAVQVDQ